MNYNSQEGGENQGFNIDDDDLSWVNFSAILNEDDSTPMYMSDSNQTNNNNKTNNNIVLTSTSTSAPTSTMPTTNFGSSNEEQLPASTNLLQFPISMEQLQQLKQKEPPPPQKVTLKSIEQLTLQLQQNNQIKIETTPIQKPTFQYQSKYITKNNNNSSNNNNNHHYNNNGTTEEQQKQNNIIQTMEKLPPIPPSPPPLPKIPTLGKELIVKLKRVNLPFSETSVYKVSTVPKTNGLGYKNKYDPVTISELTKWENFNSGHNNNTNNNNIDTSSSSLSILPFPVKVEFNEINDVHMDTTNFGFLHEQENTDLISSDITDSNYENHYYYSQGEYGQQQMDEGKTNSSAHHHQQENSEFDEICKKIGRKLLDAGKVYCPHCFDIFDHQIQLASHEILGCNNSTYPSDLIHHVDQGQRSYSPNVVAKSTAFTSSNTRTTNANVTPRVVAVSSRNKDILSLAKTKHKIPATLSIVPTKPAQPKVKAQPPSKAVVTIQPKGVKSAHVPKMLGRGPRGPYRKRDNTRLQLKARKNRNVRGGFYLCPFTPCPERFSNKEVFHGHLRDFHLPSFAPGQAIICQLCPSDPEPVSFALILGWVSHMSSVHSGNKTILPVQGITKYRRRDRRRQKYQKVQVQPIATTSSSSHHHDNDPLSLEAILQQSSSSSSAPIPPTTIQLNRNVTLTAIPSQQPQQQNPPQHQQVQQQQQQLLQKHQLIQQLQNRHKLQLQQQQQQQPKIIQIKVPNAIKGGGKQQPSHYQKQQQKKKKKDSRNTTSGRLFSCPFTPCPNNFFGSSKLFDAHLKSLHAGRKPYVCNLCAMEKEFATLFDWLVHVKMLHVREQKLQSKTSISPATTLNKPSTSISRGSINISTSNTNSVRIPDLIPISQRPGLVITEKYE